MVELIRTVNGAVNDFIWGVPAMVCILGVGLLLSVRTRFLQIRKFPYAIRTTLGRMFRKKDAADGAMTPFQAVCTALAATVGTGNIAGVAGAIAIGGPGAVFWMWCSALLGMCTKFSEVTLALHFRERSAGGNWTGGPMYYIRDGLHAPWLAFLCSIFMVVQIIGGNFIQSNTIGGVVEDTFQIPTIYTGIILTVLIFAVSAGGLKRFAHVARKVVPFMATLYIASGLLIILINIKQLPGVFADIFAGAFGLRAVSGGVLGSMIIAMQKGIARGLYSNEAGEGSAPVLHSAADVEHPAEQGIAGVTEVFLDTFVICTITGLVLGVTGVIAPGISGNVLPLYAFESVWPPMRYVLAASLLLFSTTSLMSQWYFGFVGLNYMFGRTVAEKFKYIFPCFCIFGATLKSDMVWTIQDIALGLLTIPNLIAMIFLWPKVRKATKEFFGTPRT